MLGSVLRATFTVLLRFRKVTFTILPSPTLRSAHAPCTAPPHTPRGRARSLVLWSGRVQLDRRLLAPALDAWLRVEVRATHHAEVDAVVERARTQRRRARRWRHVVFERRRHLRLLVVEFGLRHWRRLAGGQRLRGQRRLPLGRVVALRRAHHHATLGAATRRRSVVVGAVHVARVDSWGKRKRRSALGRSSAPLGWRGHSSARAAECDESRRPLQAGLTARGCLCASPGVAL